MIKSFNTYIFKISNTTVLFIFFSFFSAIAKTNSPSLIVNLNITYKVQRSNIVVVQGLVIDETGKPIEGAEVLVRERAKVVKTDTNGHYLISLAIKENLEFSHFGFKTKTIRILSNKNTNIRLKKI